MVEDLIAQTRAMETGSNRLSVRSAVSRASCHSSLRSRGSNGARATDDADILRIPRRRGSPKPVTAGFHNGEDKRGGSRPYTASWSGLYSLAASTRRGAES